MAISGVGQSYYQNNVATTKSTKSVNSMGETGNTKELSEAEEMAILKKEFYDELSRINNHRTVSNMAINISEDAFKKMKEDPQYKQQILNFHFGKNLLSFELYSFWMFSAESISCRKKI